MLLPPLPKNLAGIVLVAFLALLSGCDALEQLSGADPVDTVVRDNPVDPQSSRPLVFGLDSPDPVVATVRPSVRFSLGNGVASYSLQIATTAEFESPLAYQENGITEEVHRIATPLANHGKYYWRVRPRYSDGTEGGWSNAKELEVELPVPEGLNPTMDATIGTPFPTLSWAAIPGQSSLEVQLSPQEDFSESTVELETEQPETKVSIGFGDGESRYWRVRVVDSGVPGDWSSSQRFVVELPAPSPDYPANGAMVHNKRFEFAFQSRIPPDVTGYEVGLSSQNLPNSETVSAVELEQVNGVVLSGTWEAELTLGQGYQWRIRSTYPNGLKGPWSPSAAFTRDLFTSVISLPRSSDPHESGPYVSRFRVAPDGTLRCIGTDSRLYSLTPEGEVLWSVAVEDGDLTVGPDGSAFIQSYLDAVMAVSSDGVLLWKRPGSALDYYAGPTLDSNGNSYFALASSDQKLAVRVLKPNGNLKWEKSLPVSLFSGEQFKAPLLGPGGLVFVNAKHAIYALDAENGEVHWNYDLSASDYAGDLSFTPSGVIVPIHSQSPTTYKSLILSNSGQLVEQRNGFADDSVVLVDGAGVTYGKRGGFEVSSYFLASGPDGEIYWISDEHLSSPVLGAEGLYYAVSSTGITCRKRADNTEVWSQPIGDSVQVLSFLPSGELIALINGSLGFIDTPGLDLEAPWPMANHDPQGTRNASY